MEIEETLYKISKILVTGDTLAMTACSPHMKTLHQMSRGYVQFVQ